MNRILVPLDGSELAEAAVRPALSLAGRHDAEVHLARIVSDFPPIPLGIPEGEPAAQWLAAEEERAKNYLNELAHGVANDHGVEVDTHVAMGSVTHTLLALGKELTAELILLTTHGRGALESLWLGSVTDQLLRRSEIPILVLPSRSRLEPFQADYPRHTLVPLDGTAEAATVLDFVQGELLASGSRLTLVSVLREPPVFASTYLPHTVTDEHIWLEQQANTQSYLYGVAGGLDRQRVGKIESKVIVSDETARSLLDLCETGEVDLIALSTTGKGRAERLLLGSVADKVIRGAPVPVLSYRSH